MDEFKLQRSLLRQILDERPSVSEGMSRVQQRLLNAPYGQAWACCTGINWTAGERAWVAWLDRLLRDHPIPPDTEVAWFEVPSELNQAVTSISAYPRLGPASESYGLDEERLWPINPDGFTLPAGIHELPELEEALTLVGWRGTANDGDERLRPAVYAICFAYTILLVLNGLPRTSIHMKLNHKSGIAVLVGWAEGDVSPIGQLAAGGWGPIRRVRAASRGPRPEELDPESYSFDIRKYIAAGLDPDIRDRKWKATLLMRSRFEDPRTVKAIVDAGADVRARDRRGSGVLHWFGAAEIPVLRLLLGRGADPRAVDQDGQSVLDHVLDDGRCTLEHLRLLIDAGASLKATLRDRNTPLHSIASTRAYARDRVMALRAMLRYWLDQGYDINRRRKDGLTPLWVAMRAHADELERRVRWLRTNEDLGGDWDGRHDEVAVMILAHGADPGVRYSGPKHRLIPEGATPLMLRRYDDTRLVKALLKHGTDPLVRCAKGRLAVEYAQQAAADERRIDRKGAAAVAEMLRRATDRASRKAARGLS